MVLIPCNHHEVSLPAASATYLSEALYALASRGFASQRGLKAGEAACLCV